MSDVVERVSHATRDRAVVALVTAYFELVTGSLTASDRDAIAVAAAAACTVDRLDALAAAVEDPFAWLPFLRCIVAIPSSAQTNATRHAQEHLDAVGTDYLARHNLSILRPEDILLADNPLTRAASALFAA